ncbi:transmembrane amino acid transporter protein-domain-containing protein [Massariosphaeria phaeospora]|uniref:Transmembrane amino acid transporter protein-domain-containing protein n=1 Tax=Massariosphaeria phaeospora TaxID=100035 RepID=A0A7C8I7D6_9PLEO|nr:transmembrane amino acid transporter protein-domain-containing protein [Massariosphaeria phaeospora]
MPVVDAREGNHPTGDPDQISIVRPDTQEKLLSQTDDNLSQKLSAADAGLVSNTDVEGQVSRDLDDTFGDEAGAEIHYKTCDWWHAGILMLAENVSLGVLALPQAIAILGFVPGLLLILVIGLIAFYTGFVIGQFKLAYPKVGSFADCGEMMAGRIGREVMAVGSLLILVFIMAAHILSFAIALNVITDHATCTVIFSVVGLIISFLIGLPRTLKNVSYLSIFSSISIVVAVTIAMAAIAMAKPDAGHVFLVRPNVPLVKGLGPVMNIILAYAGHVAFFGFYSELKNPRDFPKALAIMQIPVISFYMLISGVIYYYAGPYVASPALASASPLIRKVAFGVALPTIVVAGVVNGAVACKQVYIRVWSGTNVIHQNSFKAIGSWVGICAALWTFAFIIAEAVPDFNLLLGLIAALFSSWFSFGLPGVLWLYMNKGKWLSTKRKMALTVVNFGLCGLGAAICVMGMWSSGWELHRGAAGQPFSCANNWKPSIESQI